MLTCSRHDSRKGENSTNTCTQWHHSTSHESASQSFDANAQGQVQTSAWCHNNGFHYTKLRGNVDWNAQIVWKMRTELEFQWDILEEEIGSIFTQLLATAKEQFRQLKDAIWAEDNLIGFRTQLISDINAKADDLKYKTIRIKEKFAGEVK